MQCIGLIFCLLSLSMAVDATEPDQEFEDILAMFAEEKIVVTPSRYPQPLSQSPSTVTVVTAEEIRASGAINLPDILRRVPGMEVGQSTSSDFNVSIRGNNQLLANKLLVLIDGRTFQESIQNTVAWATLPISLSEIEQIEIIRGPGSAVWGANAFDGVINIITKNPNKTETLLSSYIGNQGAVGGDLYHSSRRDDLSLSFSLGYQQADGLAGGPTALSVYRANTRIRKEISSSKTLGFSAGISDLPDYEGPQYSDGRGQAEIGSSYVQLDYETSQSFLRAYWNRFDIEQDYFIIPADRSVPLHFASNLYNVEARHQKPLGENHQLVVGMQYRLNEVKGDFSENKQVLKSLGLYLQDEWRPNPQLTVVLGARYNDHVNIEQNVSPRGSVIYQFPEGEHSLRLSAGSAYRPPTSVELYEENGGGNPDLNAERIESYELAYNTFLFGKLRGEIALFYNRLSDLIDLESAPNVNRDKAVIYGGEMGGEFIYNSWLSFFGNYAHQQINNLNLSNNEGRSGPRHKINTGIKTTSQGLSSQLLLHYKSSVRYPDSSVTFFPGRSPRVPSALLLNFWIGYKPWGEDVELGFSAFNLLNKKQRESPMGDTLERRILFRLNLKF